MNVFNEALERAENQEQKANRYLEPRMGTGAGARRHSTSHKAVAMPSPQWQSSQECVLTASVCLHFTGKTEKQRDRPRDIFHLLVYSSDT